MQHLQQNQKAVASKIFMRKLSRGDFRNLIKINLLLHNAPCILI